jgi:hypothetical protein
VAGYSGTPLVQKLGIKPGSRICILRAPKGFEQVLGDLPERVTIAERLRGNQDLVLLFSSSRADLMRRFDGGAAAISPSGSFWVAWPKKTSGVKTDLDENVVRAIGLSGKLVDVKVCAINDIWSGLKFVVRVVNRPK